MADFVNNDGEGGEEIEDIDELEKYLYNIYYIISLNFIILFYI